MNPSVLYIHGQKDISTVCDLYIPLAQYDQLHLSVVVYIGMVEKLVVGESSEKSCVCRLLVTIKRSLSGMCHVSLVGVKRKLCVIVL